MTLAERGWKFDLKSGNLGVMGNFFQKVTYISADHAYEPGDGLLVIDTTDSVVTITLPPIVSWPEQDYRIIIPIMHTAGANGIIIQLSGSETFLLGNTKFDLGAAVSAFDFYVINSATLSTYGILSDLTIKAKTTMTTDWAAASFATEAIVPFGLEFDNTGPELLIYQSYLTGAIASIADGSAGDDGVAETSIITDVAHGLSLDEFIVIAGTTNYNFEIQVVEVIDEDTFRVPIEFVDDDTGTWTRMARYSVITPGLYILSYSAQLDSTGGAAWSAVGNLYKSAEAIANTTVTVSGAAGENKTMALQPYEVHLEAGDYIDLKVDNTTFTGNMTSAVFQIEMKAL